MNRPFDPVNDPNDTNAKSFAGIDFAWTELENRLWDSASGTVRSDLSSQSKRFILSQIINTDRMGAGFGGDSATLIVDGGLRQLDPLPGSYSWQQQVQSVGGFFGFMVAHELSHNLGLLDEYFYSSPNGAHIFPNDPNFYMSTSNTLTVSSLERQALDLALDNPAEDVSLDQVDALITWFETLYSANKSSPGLSGDHSFGFSPPLPGTLVENQASARGTVVAAPATSVSTGSVALTAIDSPTQPSGSPRPSPFSARPPRRSSASSPVRPTDRARSARPRSTRRDEWTLQANPVISESLGFVSLPTEEGRTSARDNRETFQARVLDGIVQAHSNDKDMLDPASTDEIAHDVLIARQAAGVRSQKDSTEAEAIESPSLISLALGVPVIVLSAWAHVRGTGRGRSKTE